MFELDENDLYNFIERGLSDEERKIFNLFIAVPIEYINTTGFSMPCIRGISKFLGVKNCVVKNTRDKIRLLIQEYINL